MVVKVVTAIRSIVKVQTITFALNNVIVLELSW
jgi:hypothetical protein